jgi:hypothetical protein
MSFSDPANPMPKQASVMTGAAFSQPWHGYFADVERMRTALRKAESAADLVTFADLPASPSDAQIRDAVNEIKAKLNAFFESLR